MVLRLDSAIKLHKEAPYTFYVPGEYVLNLLEVGDLVKLIFLCNQEDTECYGERMWVEIIERHDEIFRGKLKNDPIYIKDLCFDDEVVFKTENICDTMYHDPTAVNWDFYFENKVIVSGDVFERNEFNFVLKDEPNNETETGWIFLSGYEDQEYNQDPNNFQVVSIGKVLNIDDSILSFFDREPYCAFKRDPKTKIFYEVFDYDWDHYLNN